MTNDYRKDGSLSHSFRGDEQSIRRGESAGSEYGGTNPSPQKDEQTPTRHLSVTQETGNIAWDFAIACKTSKGESNTDLHSLQCSDKLAKA